MKGKCPFGKLKCEECVLYRRGIRYYDDKKEPTPFEECAINIAIDCLENMVTRTISQQKATEQTRNEMAALRELFYNLAAKKFIEDRHPEIIEVTE